MPYFFLSYARGDDDTYVQAFFEDLCAELAIRVGGRAPRSLGYLGAADAEFVNDWSPDVVEALSTCHVFLALTSPRYFLNGVCGRQWWLFSDRLRRYEEQTGERPAALIPLAWGRAPLAPEIVDLVDRAGLPSTDVSLRQLVRLRSRQHAYQAFVSRLADRIVALAQAHPLPRPGPAPDFARAPNPFAAVPRPGSGGTGRSEYVHFVVAAGSRAEMSAIRTDLGFYGDDRVDWAPFQPAWPEPLGEHARVVAAGRLLGARVTDVDELAALIDAAGRDNELVVLLVDGWVTQLGAYRRLLRRIDRSTGLDRVAEAAVLVPLSSADPETSEHRGDLRIAVQETFQHTARFAPRFRLDIGSRASFDDELIALLEGAKNRLFRDGPIYRLPPGDDQSSRPILRGP